MTLALNGTTVTDLYLNGTKIYKAYLNGTEVYSRAAPAGLTIGNYSNIYYGYLRSTSTGSVNPDTHAGYPISRLMFSIGASPEANFGLEPAEARTSATTITVGPHSVVLPAYPIVSTTISTTFRDYIIANLGNTLPFSLA